MKDAKPELAYQFEREGYFCRDSEASDSLVILLIIPTYAKVSIAKVSINTFCFSGLDWFIYVKLTVRT
jgi:hypothetical protein